MMKCWWFLGPVDVVVCCCYYDCSVTQDKPKMTRRMVRGEVRRFLSFNSIKQMLVCEINYYYTPLTLPALAGWVVRFFLGAATTAAVIFLFC